LLESICELGMRCAVLSNVQARGADEYWGDFADLGIAHLIDAVVTSHEVGFRKPHPAMFQAGLTAASCLPDECVMVGDSELKDIEPTRRLGMRAIRVGIEVPPSAATYAHPDGHQRAPGAIHPARVGRGPSSLSRILQGAAAW
jgi:FMN phosphatase YigB (HAD superfamily)